MRIKFNMATEASEAYEYCVDRFGPAAALMLCSGRTHTHEPFDSSLRDCNNFKRVGVIARDGVIVIGGGQ